MCVVVSTENNEQNTGTGKSPWQKRAKRAVPSVPM